MRIAGNIFAGLAAVLGVVWMLQGAGWLGGSFMTGQTRWFWIGLATTLCGCAGLLWLYRHRRG